MLRHSTRSSSGPSYTSRAWHCQFLGVPEWDTRSSRDRFRHFVHGLKAGLGVYRRAGFELLGEVIQDDSKYGGKGEYGAYFLGKRASQEKSAWWSLPT